MVAHLALHRGLSPDAQREEIRGFVEGFLPELRGMKGFLDAYVLEGDVMAIFTLWESAEAQEAGGGRVRPAIEQLVARRKIAPPDTYVFEVAEHASEGASATVRR